MTLDPKRTFDELIDRLAPDDADARRGPRQPHLPAALERGRRLAGVHGDGQALRARPRGRLRRDRARHAAVAQRAGLPRRARPPDAASSRAARCGCSSPPTGLAARVVGRGTERRVLACSSGSPASTCWRTSRVSSARSAACSTASASARAAVKALLADPAHDVPGRHLARARARRGGDLLRRASCARPAMPFGGLIVNRVHHAVGDADRRTIERGAGRRSSATELADKVAENFADDHVLATRDRANIARLAERTRRAGDDPRPPPRRRRPRHRRPARIDRYLFATERSARRCSPRSSRRTRGTISWSPDGEARPPARRP